MLKSVADCHSLTQSLPMSDQRSHSTATLPPLNSQVIAADAVPMKPGQPLEHGYGGLSGVHFGDYFLPPKSRGGSGSDHLDADSRCDTDCTYAA